MKVLTIVGARPQFVKAFVVSRALAEAPDMTEVVLHTGQHYDYLMSGTFFRELGMRSPTYNLGVGSGRHGAQTAAMLSRIEQVLLGEQPDLALVYGDTNSTLAGALAAAKLHIPVAHVEAGLRSFRRDMPEEINRVVADHLSDFLFAPTEAAVRNLAREGIERGVHLVGDVMFDAALLTADLAGQRSSILDRLGLRAAEYGLATIHRAANTDDPIRLRCLVETLSGLDAPIVFPVHPRTRAALEAAGVDQPGGSVRAIEPVGYLDMLLLERHARCILTDSGGVQKEAHFFAVPCVTLREETEWVETLESGWNVVAGVEPGAIRDGWSRPRPRGTPPPVFGDGRAGSRIVSILTGRGGQ